MRVLFAAAPAFGKRQERGIKEHTLSAATASPALESSWKPARPLMVWSARSTQKFGLRDGWGGRRFTCQAASELRRCRGRAIKERACPNGQNKQRSAQKRPGAVAAAPENAGLHEAAKAHQSAMAASMMIAVQIIIGMGPVTAHDRGVRAHRQGSHSTNERYSRRRDRAPICCCGGASIQLHPGPVRPGCRVPHPQPATGTACRSQALARTVLEEELPLGIGLLLELVPAVLRKADLGLCSARKYFGRDSVLA